MPTALKARYVFPIAGQPIEDGVVVIEGGRIRQVGRSVPPAAEVLDLNSTNQLTPGGVALLPGLVNAHTHLEFSDLREPLGNAGMRFPDWIRTVIEHRLTLAREANPAGTKPMDAIADGAAESLRSGVTTLGEIATRDWIPEAEAEAPSQASLLREQVLVFREMLGLADQRIDSAQAELTQWHSRREAHPAWRFGVSPHAPYSTHREIVALLCRFSRDRKVPLAMHLAESREELELLASHQGSFRTLLGELGVWNPDGVPLDSRPLDYIKLLATAHRSIVVHGNYLNAEEIQFIAGHRGRMSVVYCPRTHAYFGHEPYPLTEMLSAGINVALGTDSRASNPDLNLLADMRTVAECFPHISRQTILQMGTVNGAKALGLEDDLGTLQTGKWANLAVIALPGKQVSHLDAEALSGLILASSLPNVATFVGGQQHAGEPPCQS